ncbi:hypothetical protein FB567DRAFT_280414 [Paraphoma chrysanthemicola]|uniref:Uncharacterized protein n=1 Tax=Paraphoma chrysanthemicola TaxID=798071 RepID=A0A8K0RD31_9PLEO|nr:hypothetical protein FB567DRAFT_280414 [Paraphoma chrysanthemicola]
MGQVSHYEGWWLILTLNLATLDVTGAISRVAAASNPCEYQAICASLYQLQVSRKLRSQLHVHQARRKPFFSPQN